MRTGHLPTTTHVVASHESSEEGTRETMIERTAVARVPRVSFVMVKRVDVDNF